MIILLAVVYLVLSICFGEVVINDEVKKPQFDRVVTIGDIHGSYDGLLDLLFSSNVTTESHTCEWKHQDKKLLLVQMGDVVDRGGGALQAWECLKSLQKHSATYNAEVVRLLGSKLLENTILSR